MKIERGVGIFPGSWIEKILGVGMKRDAPFKIALDAAKIQQSIQQIKSVYARGLSWEVQL